MSEVREIVEILYNFAQKNNNVLVGEETVIKSSEFKRLAKAIIQARKEKMNNG